MVIERRIAHKLRSEKKSILLIGPRQTGKSTLIRSLKPDLEINLMNEVTYLSFSRNPGELEERLADGRPGRVFIDEIQRIPSLLNTIQTILDDPKNRTQFFITGSSARKLRRGHANLLPGRIHVYWMTPLLAGEIGAAAPLERCLATGTLPGIYTEPDEGSRKATLRSYASTYLREEIQAEALTRNIEGFSRFLNVTAACCGDFLDLSKLSKEAQIPRQTAVRFFEILEDTLIVKRCEPFAASERRRLIQHPKYYFFDSGVLNALMGNFRISEDRIGKSFENFIVMQISHAIAAGDLDARLSTYRTSAGAEVDLVLERDGVTWAIEIKSSQAVHDSFFSGFKSFEDYRGKKIRKLLIYAGKVRRSVSGVAVLPWADALRELGL